MENAPDLGSGFFFIKLGGARKSNEGYYAGNSPDGVNASGKGLIENPGMGFTYYGDVLDGQPHGHGYMLDDDGDRYEGEFQKGTRHGQGMCLVRCFLSCSV